MRAKGAGDVASPGAPGWYLWRRLRRPATKSEEAERWLELAGFAEGRLAAKDRKRIATLIARDSEAAMDVAAARALGGIAALPAGQEVIARAVALIDRPRSSTPPEEYGQVIAFRAQPAVPRLWRNAAGWSSLAAAMVVAGWLGFGLGSGMLPPDPDRIFEDAAAGLLDPAPALVRDFTEGWQT